MIWGMSRKRLMQVVDFDLVRLAIVEAESQSSGEIRVSVAPWFWGNVERAAERAFVRLGMSNTQERNGILFFIVPARRSFMVLGDSGIHERVGQEFWDRLAAILSSHFKKREFTEGLVVAVRTAGERLAHFFPYRHGDDVNELPDAVDVD